MTALSQRERAILSAAAHGKGAKETAAELHVSAGYVRNMRSALLARLGVPNVTAAVWAVRHDLEP